MKTDKQLYLLLGADPEFLRLLTDGIRIDGPYRFEALDVKALERRIDGVLIPDATDQALWAMEIQAQRDPLIWHRLLIDMGLLGERYPDRPVHGCLLFVQTAADPRTEPWHSFLADHPEAPIRRVYLPELLQRLAETQPEHPLLAVFLPYLEDDPARLRALAPERYRRLKSAPLSERARRHCLDVFQSWLMARFNDLTLEEILTMLGELTPLEETRAYRELVAKGAEIGRREGRREGREEGREEGRAEGLQREAELIRRQLVRRLGALSPTQLACLNALAIEDLEALGEALLDFRAAADLEAWLARH